MEAISKVLERRKMTARFITLRPSTFTRYANRDGKVTCIKCGRKFRKNDKAVSKPRGSARGGRRKILFCIKCAKEARISY